MNLNRKEKALLLICIRRIKSTTCNDSLYSKLINLENKIINKPSTTTNEQLKDKKSEPTWLDHFSKS
jgi:hypothetical protein